MQNQLFAEYDERRSFIRQILHGVNYIHQNNVIHRDLKLSNVMLDQNNQVKIGDFGLAIETNASVSDLQKFCGTVVYMPPEIINKQGAVFQSDIWSVAVIAYYLLKGQRPYDKSFVFEDTKCVCDRIRSLQYRMSDHDDRYFVQFIGSEFQCDPTMRPMAKKCLDMPLFSEHRNLRKRYICLYSFKPNFL